MRDFDDIVAHLEWVADVDFLPASDNHSAVVRVTASGVESVMEVTRDSEPAAPGDVDFVAHCISDVRELLLAVTSGGPVEPQLLVEVSARIEAASPAPWCACIEADGGLAGCDVILVTDDDAQPDLYLWANGSLAAAAYFRFVAAARQDIPRLLDVARATQ